jgi:hypothetical protein
VARQRNCEQNPNAQLKVEHLAGIDRPVPDEVDQLGQEPANRGWAAVQVHMREERLLAGQLHTVGEPGVFGRRGAVFGR